MVTTTPRAPTRQLVITETAEGHRGRVAATAEPLAGR